LLAGIALFLGIFHFGALTMVKLDEVTDKE
jgi:hypothetical protein